MPAPSIRPAEPRDIAAITRIYAHAVRHGTASFELEPPDEAEIGRRYAALRDGGFPFLAAEIGGEVAGYAYAGPYRARPAYRFTVEDSIYIDPQMQRRGLGRALLDRLLIEAEARSFRQMIAVIGDSAQTPSITLHQAAGFRMVGTFEAVGFKFGRWLDSVLMQKALGPGATTTP
jgi:phosphinothricin acetyltransferase